MKMRTRWHGVGGRIASGCEGERGTRLIYGRVWWDGESVHEFRRICGRGRKASTDVDVEVGAAQRWGRGRDGIVWAEKVRVHMRVVGVRCMITGE